MEDKKDLFEKKEEVKVEKKSFVATKVRHGKVANIVLPQDGRKGRIIIDVKGTGEMIDYNTERHAQLKVGDPIDF